MTSGPGPSRAVLVIHAGAGPGSAPEERSAGEHRAALRASLDRGRSVLEAGGDAVEAVRAAIVYMEDAVPFFNAGRGSVLCCDGSVEMSAALMRGRDRAAGAVAMVRRSRQPILAAAAVLERSPHVLLAGAAADAFGAAAGLEQRDPSYFVTERQRTRLQGAGTDFTRGTVGAVCLDAAGQLAAGTSTGGRRGQAPGRTGDTPVIGAGTWADHGVAVSCTGDGEEFIRAGAARQLALHHQSGMTLEEAADRALREGRPRRAWRPDRRRPARTGRDAVHVGSDEPRDLTGRRGAGGPHLNHRRMAGGEFRPRSPARTRLRPARCRSAPRPRGRSGRRAGRADGPARSAASPAAHPARPRP